MTKDPRIPSLGGPSHISSHSGMHIPLDPRTCATECPSNPSMSELGNLCWAQGYHPIGPVATLGLGYCIEATSSGGMSHPTVGKTSIGATTW